MSGRYQMYNRVGTPNRVHSQNCGAIETAVASDRIAKRFLPLRKSRASSGATRFLSSMLMTCAKAARISMIREVQREEGGRVRPDGVHLGGIQRGVCEFHAVQQVVNQRDEQQEGHDYEGDGPDLSREDGHLRPANDPRRDFEQAHEVEATHTAGK